MGIKRISNGFVIFVLQNKEFASLKSICQVTKLSVSNSFGKIELAKPNGGPGHYFFTRFFSSRHPLCRAGSLARSPAHCVALPPPLVRVVLRVVSGVGGTKGGLELMASGGAILRLRQRTAARVEVFLSRAERWHVLTLCRDRDSGACGGVSSRGGQRHVVRLCVAKRSQRRDRSAFAKSSGVWQKCQVSSLICQLCQNAKLKCKTIGYLNLSFFWQISQMQTSIAKPLVPPFSPSLLVIT